MRLTLVEYEKYDECFNLAIAFYRYVVDYYSAARDFHRSIRKLNSATASTRSHIEGEVIERYKVLRDRYADARNGYYAFANARITSRVKHVPRTLVENAARICCQYHDLDKFHEEAFDILKEIFSPYRTSDMSRPAGAPYLNENVPSFDEYTRLDTPPSPKKARAEHASPMKEPDILSSSIDAKSFSWNEGKAEKAPMLEAKPKQHSHIEPKTSRAPRHLTRKEKITLLCCLSLALAVMIILFVYIAYQLADQV
ncbi:hypothetical protein K470DRAFT_262915 [Piedraia hortae CBS 480.64]|uniref:Uncharacterized protein n=1 Tax=Piedraia hortae CBS 480.64 TaxID=1314780 RepID=A0A6A7C567_9PEZI|nr:hypothetical protein K470DRAFT_262915 [Piedraia hortae CBS 480.64]